jgi:hypothetical protein
MFGGILRHLFHEERFLQIELDRRLGRGRLEQFLKSVATNIDTVEEGNDNASGYLVCYTDIPHDGGTAFESRELMPTSTFVSDKIRESIKLATRDEKAQKVLEVLAGARNVDLGGKYPLQP